MRRSGRAPRQETIVIAGTIGSHITAKIVRSQLARAADANALVVWISSIGGSVPDAFEMYAAIVEHPAASKTAIVEGACQSAAILPLLACDCRIATRDAEIAIHQVAINPKEHRGVRWTADAHRFAAQRNQEFDAAIADVLAVRTGFSRAWFVETMAKDAPLRLVDALKVGLIHEIDGVTPPVDARWPSALEKLSGPKAGTRAILGCPGYRFSPSYLAACRVAAADRRPRR
jgi:ATP-dependent protease ClpP protease subunit